MTASTLARQHLIDPEICIRCNTCEATCPVGAITHDSRNYVVNFEKCNLCMACIGPCPTGSIDNWRDVEKSSVYSLEEQLSWDELPAQATTAAGDTNSLPADVVRMTDEASAGQGGIGAAPWSALPPQVNLYNNKNPAIATVAGNFRLTGDNASSDIRHIVLDFGSTPFPVLEGQNIGILPPGLDANGKPHYVRMYSIASPRDGERRGYNNISLTIKRVTEDHQGKPTPGVGSNYMCDLKRDDKVQVIGPYGATFLMPNHPGSSLLMICTGTGSAPMRAMTEFRRRHKEQHDGGKLMLFFGARAQDELPYFGPLMKLPKDFIDINFAFSRAPGQPKQYVQDLIRKRATDVAQLLQDENSFIYVCGLKGMEDGVKDAFKDICAEHGMDWEKLQPKLVAKARFHIETY
ncbi:MAG: benzoyl-CoA 2,3-epoxidase subunit BoxA [Burkholderiales bacterium]